MFQLMLKLAQWFWRKDKNMKNLQPDGRTDRRRTPGNQRSSNEFFSLGDIKRAKHTEKSLNYTEKGAKHFRFYRHKCKFHRKNCKIYRK